MRLHRLNHVGIVELGIAPQVCKLHCFLIPTQQKGMYLTAAGASLGGEPPPRVGESGRALVPSPLGRSSQARDGRISPSTRAPLPNAPPQAGEGGRAAAGRGSLDCHARHCPRRKARDPAIHATLDVRQSTWTAGSSPGGDDFSSSLPGRATDPGLSVPTRIACAIERVAGGNTARVTVGTLRFAHPTRCARLLNEPVRPFLHRVRQQ